MDLDEWEKLPLTQKYAVEDYMVVADPALGGTMAMPESVRWFVLAGPWATGTSIEGRYVTEAEFDRVKTEWHTELGRSIVRRAHLELVEQLKAELTKLEVD